MSKNSKNRNKRQVAKSVTEIRKAGGKGPAKTATTHGKVNTWHRRGRPSVKQDKGAVKDRA